MAEGRPTRPEVDAFVGELRPLLSTWMCRNCFDCWTASHPMRVTFNGSLIPCSARCRIVIGCVGAIWHMNHHLRQFGFESYLRHQQRKRVVEPSEISAGIVPSSSPSASM